MRKNNVQEILNYYLEYEIYNIINSAQIKIDDKTSIVMTDISNQQSICEIQSKLKVAKLREKILKFIGKKVENKEELVKLIVLELDKLDDVQSNQVQVAFQIIDLIKKRLKQKIDDKVIEVFVSELCDIKASQEFWLYAHNISVNGEVVKKLPIFIFKCKIEDNTVNIEDVNINAETLNTVLAVILNKETTDVVLEYKEKIDSYSQEIKLTLDAGEIMHILELYYSKMKEYLDLDVQDIKHITKINNKYNMNEEYVISLDELAEEGIRNIKEDLELLNRLIAKDNNIPNLLNKYLCGTSHKKDINHLNYRKMYRGNYKSSYGVGANQYKIVNTIKDNDLIAIQGPPGTGKTSLLKEIIANKIVERADLILKNWNKKLEPRKYYGTTYYNIDWYKDDDSTVKSIVVSSKNGEAIENVGKEINQEVRYMFPAARKYQRTQMANGSRGKVLQKYKGMICLPLGKQDNIKDFGDFLYQKFIPLLDKMSSRTYSEEVIEKIRRSYKDKVRKIELYEQLLHLLEQIQDRKKYFYEKKNVSEIQKLFLEEKELKQMRFDNIKIERHNLEEQKKEQKEILNVMEEKLKSKEKEIKYSQQIIADGISRIEDIKKEQQIFEQVNKNFFTRIMRFKIYNKNKNINFLGLINETNMANKLEEEKKAQYIEDKIAFENQKQEASRKYEKLREKLISLEKDELDLKNSVREMDWIEKFNQLNEKQNTTYWDYADEIEIYGKSSLNVLNQELFELALKLNEVYIIKNSKEIIENLKLFLPKDEKKSFICQKFYDSSDFYNAEKQEGIKCLWNTLFLCFPIVTTTLDSFCKRCFHLMPEYIDLELIDEAGQILPHNLVSAIYRAKKAVIVGDVNQIEPIYHPIYKSFHESEKRIGENFENIKIEENSIQALANKNTDILNHKDTIILNDHYRCERNIVNFSNENVYQNKLNMHIPDNYDKPFFSNMVVLDVRGKKESDENVNMAEIESCIETIKYIKAKSQKEPSIAVITPFRKQKVEIENRLKKEKLNNIKVGTVHAFQGQEKDYIIFSAVIDSTEKRSAVKFIGNKANMLNVAVTRAKKQFIYIGNLNVAIRAENYMTKLVKYIQKNGLVYSLYNMENTAMSHHLDKKIFRILQPELKLENDNIGLYIAQNIENGVIIDAKQHYEFLKYVMKNAKKKNYIVAPWIGKNVINEEFLKDIRELKKKNGEVKIVFGYKKGNKNVETSKELAEELTRTGSLGYATQEEVEEISEKMYQTIGKENFVYCPPIHAKILIIDDSYICMGSHNWLSNAGKMSAQERAKEGTSITTSKHTINYVKENFFTKKY